MNAKHLTLCCVVLLICISKFFLMPALAETNGASQRKQNEAKKVEAINQSLQMVRELPDIEVTLLKDDLATAARVSEWQSSMRNFGVNITQVTPKGNAQASSQIEIAALSQTDSVTNLTYQQVRVEGTYTSISDLLDYTKKEFDASKGIVIDAVKINGYQFEYMVSIFSQKTN